jgi:hypothetical protein
MSLKKGALAFSEMLVSIDGWIWLHILEDLYSTSDPAVTSAAAQNTVSRSAVTVVPSATLFSN